MVDLVAAASTGGGTLRPEETFWARCENLLDALRVVVDRALPGWQIVPFGSVVQRTCLRGAVLDVALVWQGSEVPHGDPVESFVAFLLQHNPEHFVRLPLRSGLAQAVHLQAGDFRDGRHIPQQDIAIYLGSATTGAQDRLIASLLARSSKAQLFVLLVKQWAFDRGLTGEGTRGSFPWTLLAIFSLQRQGELPGLRALDSAAGVGSRPPQGGENWGFRFMLRGFVELVLDHLQTGAQSLSLWTGSIDDATSTGLPSLGGSSGSSSLSIVEELRGLRLALSGRHPRTEGYTSAPSSSHVRAMTPPLRARAEWVSPPGLERLSLLNAVGWEVPWTSSSAPELLAMYGASMPSSIPPFPCLAAPPLSTSQSSSRRHAKRTQRLWTVNDSWVASCREGGQTVETVQIDRTHLTNMALTRAELQTRLNRREWQIRVGKETKEYGLWCRLRAHRGQQQGDPETPRVPVSLSKKEFEAGPYSKWRHALHVAAREARALGNLGMRESDPECS